MYIYDQSNLFNYTILFFCFYKILFHSNNHRYRYVLNFIFIAFNLLENKNKKYYFESMINRAGAFLVEGYI